MQIDLVLVIVDNETWENVTTTFVAVIRMSYSMKLMNEILCFLGYDAMMKNLLAPETLAQRAVLSIFLD
ncbi:hypothetical protein LR48_Vigan05g146300 [Vigna angularis]|uniref:Uncharacterized protein n=1 Tax=Phaseolus angularis TaxID=3914 RepID=A0A0L9UM73_PHAAN|nr:hypothetical protein LR48_Vigan05g146300 [Vigna angularis]